jgi:hypothetical protein
VGRPVTVPAPPADLLDPQARADTSRPEIVSDRTRNGLVKRPARGRLQPPTAAVSRVDSQARPGTLDESPAQLRDRLVSLRAGILRGDTERRVEPERGNIDR